MGDAGTAGSSGAERPLRFAILGAGMAGILSAIKLREAGYRDFTVFEKGDRVGRHLAREHLSGPFLRRPLPSL